MVAVSPPAPEIAFTVYLLGFGTLEEEEYNGLGHLNLYNFSFLFWARGDWWRGLWAKKVMQVKRFKNFPACYPIRPQEIPPPPPSLESAKGGRTQGLS